MRFNNLINKIKMKTSSILKLLSVFLKIILNFNILFKLNIKYFFLLCKYSYFYLNNIS